MIALTWLLMQALTAFLFGTLLFDIAHYTMHKSLKSSNKLLRAFGRIHRAHHQFYSASLQINQDMINKNFLQHVLLEHAIQGLGTILCLFFLSPKSIIIALTAQAALFIYVYKVNGIDAHHKPIKKLMSNQGGLFVNANYHALHHIYPNYFFSGYIKLLDYFLGTALPLAGKRIVMTGANGALGTHMKQLLEREGATVTNFKFGVDYDYQHYEKFKQPLMNADILFLCHGSKYEFAQEANCDSFIHLIELFKTCHPYCLVPLEIWAVGSEIEFHPCFGIKKLYVYASSKRNYAKAAREYFHANDIQYRHIVHSAFTSRMGPGLMSAKFAAKITLFLLKRGFKYVPVSYTGFAFMNYFRFAFARNRYKVMID